MLSNAVYVVATVVLAFGVIFAGFRWLLHAVYKRGASEREYKLALENNTESNKELTGAVGKVVDKLNEHDRRFDHVEWRLDKLEAPTNVHVSVGPAPHRDSGLA
jgi:hypothetical protein